MRTPPLPPPSLLSASRAPSLCGYGKRQERRNIATRNTESGRERHTQEKEKRRGEGRSVGLCLPHRPLLLLLLICCCLSVCLGLSLPFEDLLFSSLLSLQKSFCLSLTICNSSPQTKKKKKEKKRLLQKFCSQSEVL